ncbi:MAG TPA: hypothetical protein VHM27_13130 [Rhizomicrobium sp.]|jgi:hypothetical protein|nr:hypothetical protein [Rhizomicrobium sp.]
MIAFDPSQKMMGRIQVAAPQAAPVAPAATTDTAQAESGEKKESFFQHILDVINPLQHLPIIGTIYRAATGERLDPVEKIAGDAIYGGLWGAVTAVADVAFEAITGKSVEDTVMAWFKGDSTPRQVAKLSPSHIQVLQSLPSGELPALPSTEIAGAQPDTLEIAALTGALSSKGVDNDTANRALYAYRRSVAMSTPLTPVMSGLY